MPEGSVTVAVTVRTPLFGISSAGISTSTFPFLISSAVNTLVTSGRPSPSVSTFRTSPALASFGNVIVAVTPAAISSAFNNSSPPSLITTVGADGGVTSFGMSLSSGPVLPEVSVASATTGTPSLTLSSGMVDTPVVGLVLTFGSLEVHVPSVPLVITAVCGVPDSST